MVKCADIDGVLLVMRRIALVLLASAGLHAVASIQITKPYKPSFALRYPKTTKVIAASAATGIGYCIAQGCSDSCFAATAAGLGAGIAGYLLVDRYQRANISFLLLLLTDPRRALLACRAKGGNNCAEGMAICAELARVGSEVPQRLDECSSVRDLQGKETSTCSLNRLVNPHYRNFFEDEVVSKVDSLFKEKQEQGALTLISFGSGALFPDFVILTRILAQRPTATINFHFIDLEYAVLGSESIIITKETDFGDLGRDCEAQQEASVFKYNIWPLLQEFYGTISKLFPSATVSLMVHKNTANCFKQLNAADCVDIIYAADFEKKNFQDNDLVKFKNATKAVLAVLSRDNPEKVIWYDNESV